MPPINTNPLNLSDDDDDDDEYNVNNLGMHVSGRAILTTISYPFNYVKTLIQIGHEPMPPFPTKTIFGSHRLGLPNVFTYMRYITNKDGFFGLYRGLSYKLAKLTVYSAVNYQTHKSTLSLPFFYVLSTKKESNEGLDRVVVSFKSACQKTICTSVAIIACQPFEVILVRCCAQFVGRENIYDSFTSAVMDIYTNEGIRGFYSGLMPSLIFNLAIIWVSDAIILVITSPKTWNEDLKGNTKMIMRVIRMFVRSLFYPLRLVSTVMCINSCPTLSAALIEPKFIGWKDCWKYLSALAETKRGSSLIWRYKMGPQYKSAFI